MYQASLYKFILYIIGIIHQCSQRVKFSPRMPLLYSVPMYIDVAHKK